MSENQPTHILRLAPLHRNWYNWKLSKICVSNTSLSFHAKQSTHLPKTTFIVWLVSCIQFISYTYINGINWKIWEEESLPWATATDCKCCKCIKTRVHIKEERERKLHENAQKYLQTFCASPLQQPLKLLLLNAQFDACICWVELKFELFCLS